MTRVSVKDLPQPSWGWRLQCQEPGCANVVHHWATPYSQGGHYDFGETPPLAPGEGWFLRVERLPPRTQYHCHFYRTYCPDHSARALQWSRAVRDWKVERREAGRAASKMVERAKALFHAVIGKEVRAWEEDHPRPQPPWGE